MQFPELPALRDCWYVIGASETLACGAMRPLTIMGEKIILLRDADGGLSALRDFCPHRGIPLSYGRFDGREVECCYHGWCFSTQGICTKIPALPSDDIKTDISKIKARRYDVAERDGVIWLYAPREGAATAPLQPLPDFGVSIPGGLRWVESATFPCDLDHAVIGLMDPSHGPYVHQSWWWRSSRSMHDKAKDFGPIERGFAMLNHTPSRNSRAYKILGGGGARSTEIAFRLPGLRSEHITIGKHQVFLLTALTPVDAQTTVLHQFMGTTMPLMKLLKPLLVRFGRAFIQQDLEIVRKQQEGLQGGDHPPLMLLGDADQQAIWYYRLKKEAHSAAEEGRPFANPVKPRTLRWRS